ncbi:MAG: glycine cleavage T C-terminal barrel domain-containing protein, partial [Pseudomonadota bacterium]
SQHEAGEPLPRLAGRLQRIEAGVRPAGLGARDSLRLEAGLNLYGQDMDETTGPCESNLGWTIALDDPERRFIGRDALESAGKPRQRLTGLVLEGRGVLRAQQTVTTTAGAGVTTSGGFSPTLKRSIALARVPAGAGDAATVDVRGKALPVRLVRPPFVRRGKSNIDEKRETS